MTPQEAVKILMLSPCYWLLSLRARKELILEYCASYNAVAAGTQSSKSKKQES